MTGGEGLGGGAATVTGGSVDIFSASCLGGVASSTSSSVQSSISSSFTSIAANSFKNSSSDILINCFFSDHLVPLFNTAVLLDQKVGNMAARSSFNKDDSAIQRVDEYKTADISPSAPPAFAWCLAETTP